MDGQKVSGEEQRRKWECQQIEDKDEPVTQWVNMILW